MATLNGLTVSDTGYLRLPAGTTAQRPGPTVQYFTSNGPATFNVPTGVTSVEVLVVAGGGAGGGSGQYHNGGGGAGGVVWHTNYPVSPGGTVSLAVGAGGTAGAAGGPGPTGTSGSDSTFGSLTAKGGGVGGAYNFQAGQPGGSGGGGMANGTPTFNAAGTATQPGTSNPGTTQYGFPGGTGNQSGGGGGGGGAGGAGGNAGATSGDGGVGIANSIAGYSVYYAGGGGGSAYVPSGVTRPGYGGRGGGGGGGTDTWNPPQIEANGKPNTGGGGGGMERSDNRSGSAGGPGVVIVKYTIPANNVTLATGMTRLNTDSGLVEVYDGTWWSTYSKTIITFTENGLKNFTVPAGITNMWVLVVGGGGGAGTCIAGGGGAGGFVEVTNYPVYPGQVIPFNVGRGGINSDGQYGTPSLQRSYPSPQMMGQPSFFGNLVAMGGGGGGNYNIPGGPGGSGGGGGGNPAKPGGTGLQPLITSSGYTGYGNPGGASYPGNDFFGGGGGGAGAAGQAGSPTNAGDGGAGRQSSITGVATYYAGGGGGGEHVNGAPSTRAGYGGAGGGGTGRSNVAMPASERTMPGVFPQDPAQPGRFASGGGGGGGSHNSGDFPGGFGGPGVIIVRY